MSKSMKEKIENKPEIQATIESSLEMQCRREVSKAWYKFGFLEQPGQSAPMSPGYVPFDPSTGKRKKKSEYHRFELQDGEIYELPMWLVEHLSSLTVPEPYTIKQPGGKIQTGVRHRNRFMLTPVAPPVLESLEATG
jgi:hypothetical protein